MAKELRSPGVGWLATVHCWKHVHCAVTSLGSNNTHSIHVRDTRKPHARALYKFGTLVYDGEVPKLIAPLQGAQSTNIDIYIYVEV